MNMKLALSHGTNNNYRGDLEMEALVQDSRRTGLLKNEKGLTLIELLAVIVILAVIAAIAIPSIGGIINKTKKESHRANAQIIIDAARYKVSVEGYLGDATSQVITLNTLHSEGFLEKIPKNPQGTAANPTYTVATTVVTVEPTPSGTFTYSITLIGNGVTYFNDVDEAAVSTSTLGVATT
jgi:type IV pilus assembly protein PilA